METCVEQKTRQVEQSIFVLECALLHIMETADRTAYSLEALDRLKNAVDDASVALRATIPKEDRCERHPTLFANAVLKNGKLLFYYSGPEKFHVEDFHRNFIAAGINMMAELQDPNIKYELVKKPMFQMGNAAFDEADMFYSQYALSEQFIGTPPKYHVTK